MIRRSSASRRSSRTRIPALSWRSSGSRPEFLRQHILQTKNRAARLLELARRELVNRQPQRLGFSARLRIAGGKEQRLSVGAVAVEREAFLRFRLRHFDDALESRRDSGP